MLSTPKFIVALFVIAAVETASVGILALNPHIADMLLQSASAQTASVASSTGGTFDNTLALVITGGYVLMFIGMAVEGPITTAAASFAAALGYFNIWIVLTLAISGDLIIDSACYWIGYVGRIGVVERFGHRFGLTRERMRKLEQLVKTHPGKAITLVKLTPLIPIIGLITIGATHMSFRKYVVICLAVIVPAVSIFAALGYFFGEAYDSISKNIQHAEYFIFFAAIGILLVYYIFKKITARISNKLGSI